MRATEACDESLLSDAAVSNGKRCTRSSGQDALAEGRSLRGVRSRQVLADRVHEQDWRTAAFVSVCLPASSSSVQQPEPYSMIHICL